MKKIRITKDIGPFAKVGDELSVADIDNTLPRVLLWASSGKFNVYLSDIEGYYEEIKDEIVKLSDKEGNIAKLQAIKQRLNALGIDKISPKELYVKWEEHGDSDEEIQDLLNAAMTVLSIIDSE